MLILCAYIQKLKNIFFFYANTIYIKSIIKERIFIMDNNKNRMRDREKSNPELREMHPKDNADVGIINGQIIGVHESKHEKRRPKK